MNQRRRIEWEYVSQDVQVYTMPAQRPMSVHLLLRRQAIAKMIDVILISTEFDATPVIYEPWVSVLIDSGTDLEFLAIYKSDEWWENKTEEQPALCLRKSTWNRDTDLSQFYQAPDKQSYLLGSEQIAANIAFETPANISKLDLLAGRGITLAKHGLSLKDVKRDEFLWQSLRCEMSAEGQHFLLSYLPRAATNEALENWITEWKTTFDQIKFPFGEKPGSGVRISYREGIWQLLAREFVE